jgi:dihydrofolate reductase
MDEASWNNSTLIDGDVAEAVSELRQEPGGDILVNGSVQLVRELTRHGLVDEYRFMVFPVVLGGGKRLFGDEGDMTALRLVEARPVGECLILRYEPAAREAA